MIALILAGGKGTRLYPHTKEIPKSLLTINGKTILSHQIETLLNHNVSHIFIVTGFLSNLIEKHISDNFKNISISFIHNDEYENSRPAYAIIKSLPYLKEETIYLNGDVMYDPRILQKIISSKKDCCTAVQRVPWDEEEVNVIIDKENRITSISKNIPEEESHGEFIGITKFSTNFLKKMNEIINEEGVEVFRFSFAVDLINHTINTKKQDLFSEDVTEYNAIEIDTIDDYNKANQF